VLKHHGVDVLSCLEGRSERTKNLAKEAGLRVVPNDEALVAESDIILSVLVPSNAGEVVDRLITVAQHTKLGNAKPFPLFVELNAIAPETVQGFAHKMQKVGIDLVDGSIIGGPPKVGQQIGGGKSTKLYVSGARAKEVEVLREHGLDIRYTGEEIGQASGLKMVYAAMTKGMLALGTQAMVAASAMGLTEAYEKELRDSQPQLLAVLSGGIPSMCPKAYRWHGEMEEIASTYKALGLTGKVYEGIADVYRFVESTPLGKEVPEERKIGKTLDDAVNIMVKHLPKKGIGSTKNLIMKIYWGSLA